MKTKSNKGSLRTSFLIMTLMPILLVGIIIMAVAFYRGRSTVYDEVKEGMGNVAYAIANTYDSLYPGEYEVVRSDTLMGLKKGDKLLDNRYLANIYQDTGLNTTLFYGDLRMLTSLTDHQGKDLVGVSMNLVIRRQVLDADAAMFYENTNVNGDAFFAYYMPIHNGAGEVVGAIEVLKPSHQVNLAVAQSVIPMLVVVFVVMAIAGFFSWTYGKNIRKALEAILKFLQSVQKGNLKTEIREEVAARSDEIGEMATAASAMQFSLRELVEKDALTKLYNRRYANKYLKEVWKSLEESGGQYCVCIGDIDFFKKVNDTYGHDAGDLVLQTVAAILRKHMTGKGMVARWGGEEFLFVFEDRDLNTSTDLLWEILAEIRETMVPYEDQEIRFTMSYGVVDSAGLSIEDALKTADEHLYYAKEHGRNQVVNA